MSNRGFTLIETLVYLALFGLIMGGMVAAAYVLFESSDRNQTKAMLQEEQNFVMGKIIWALNAASGASVSGSTLMITKYASPNAVIDLSGTDARLNGDILNNTNVMVDNLSFVHSGVPPAESIEINLTMSARTPTGMTITQSAATTRYIRK